MILKLDDNGKKEISKLCYANNIVRDERTMNENVEIYKLGKCKHENELQKVENNCN